MIILQQIDMLGLICEAWGYNDKIYKDIDKLYDSKKYECYKLAKNNPWYNHPIINEGSLIQVEHCKKALGILLYQQENPNDIDFLKQVNHIIQKGWNYTHAFIMNHNKINFSKFITNFVKKKKGIHNITDDEVNSNIVILLTLSISLGKEINQKDKGYLSTVPDIVKRLDYYENKNFSRISLDIITDEEKEELKSLKEKLLIKIYKQTIKRKAKMYMDKANIDEHDKETLELILQIKDFNQKQFQEIVKFLNIPNIKNYTTYMDNLYETINGIASSFLYDYHNLSESLLNYTNFTNQDIDEIIYAYMCSCNSLNKEKSIDKLLDFFICAFHIKGMIKAYNQAKDYYFQNNKETMYIEMEYLEKELKEANEIFEFNQHQSHKIFNKLGAAENKIQKLEKELQQEKQKNVELNSLREFMFSLDKEVEYKNIEVNIDKLKEINGVIIGGHEKWQQKMKEYLPKFIFIHTDMLNFDVTALNGVKDVFFYINYLNHAIYYKVIEYIKNKDVKIHYINVQNEDLVLKNIYNVYYN